MKVKLYLQTLDLSIVNDQNEVLMTQRASDLCMEINVTKLVKSGSDLQKLLTELAPELA